MSSARQIASNRKNAEKSTGPRSEIGRRHSSRNALRHGLAVAIGTDPSFSKDIEMLAKSFSGGKAVGEFARQMAEAELDLLRIRKLRASLFRTVLENGAVDLSEHDKLHDSLVKLERYERRAYARRKRAWLAIMGR